MAAARWGPLALRVGKRLAAVTVAAALTRPQPASFHTTLSFELGQVQDAVRVVSVSSDAQLPTSGSVGPNLLSAQGDAAHDERDAAIGVSPEEAIAAAAGEAESVPESVLVQAEALVHAGAFFLDAYIFSVGVISEGPPGSGARGPNAVGDPGPEFDTPGARRRRQRMMQAGATEEEDGLVMLGVFGRWYSFYDAADLQEEYMARLQQVLAQRPADGDSDDDTRELHRG